MVMCSYGNEIAVTSRTEHTRLHDIRSFVIGKWTRVKEESFTLSYRVNGYSKRCM